MKKTRVLYLLDLFEGSGGNNGQCDLVCAKRLQMIGLMVVMLMVLFTCDKLVLVLWGVGPILTNECRIWGQNYVALFQDNEMSAWLHSRNLILGLEFFFFFCFIYPVEEFSLLLLCWCQSRELGG